MIELFLECQERRPECITVRLQITNRSAQRLLLPHPEITDLVFTDSATGQPAEWFTSLLVSSSWSGFTLEPGQRHDVSFAVRPCSIQPSAADKLSTYFRYCVELRSGSYTVNYSLTVDYDYFDGDSHWGFPQLEREASRRSATPWTGRARSNDITINVA